MILNRVTFLLLLVLSSCTTGEKKRSSEGGIVELEPRDFSAKRADNPQGVLVDVRTAREISEGMIRGAVHIDFKDPLFKVRIDSLNKDKPYFVYCYSGKRSSDAAKQIVFSKAAF